MRLAEQTAILGLSLTMLLLPAGLAVALVEQARASLIAPQRIQYLQHHPPDKTAGEFQANPSYRFSVPCLVKIFYIWWYEQK